MSFMATECRYSQLETDTPTHTHTHTDPGAHEFHSNSHNKLAHNT